MYFRVYQMDFSGSELIRYCFDSKKRQITVIRLAENVHLYRDRHRKVIYHFPAPVVDICFDSSTADVKIVFVDISGHIFILPLPTFKKKARLKTSLAQGKSASASLLFQSTSEPVTIVSSNQIVTTVPKCRAIMCVNSWLVTVSSVVNSWKVSLYNVGAMSTTMQPEACINVPSSSTSSLSSSQPSSSYSSSPLLSSQDVIAYCAIPSQCSIVNSSHIHLDPALHQCLLKTDQPVILLSPGDGHIFYIPLPSADSCFIESLQLKLLYHSSHLYVGLHATQIKSVNDDGNSEDLKCLLLVTCSGHLVAISSDGHCLKYSQLCVPGPVTCSHVCCATLYHTTPREVFSTELVIDNQYTSLSIPTCIGTMNVKALASIGGNSPELLFAVLKSGRVKFISPGNDLTKHSYLATSDRLKDLLTRIGAVHRQLNRTSELFGQYSDVLVQLNLASHIASANKPDKAPIKFECAVTQQELGMTFELIVECKLINGSSIALGDGWTVSIGLEMSNCEDGKAISQSLRLHKLQPQQCQLVRIPLTLSIVRCVPINVKPVMIYSFSAGSIDGASVEVVLSPAVVDYIDLLRPLPGFAQSLKDAESDIINVINKIGEQRKCALGYSFTETCEEHGVSACLVVPRAVKKKRKPDEQSFLQFLFHGSLVKPNSCEQDFIRAVSPDGCQVSLSVSTKDDNVEVTVHAPSRLLLWSVMSSLHAKIQRLSNIPKSAPLVTKALRQYLSHVEEVKVELECIKDLTPEITSGLYWQLRKKPLP